MWFLIAAFALSVLLIIFYRLRQQSGETVSDKDKMRMEVSSDIGIPLEVIDPEKQVVHAERRAGVALPRAPQGEESACNTKAHYIKEPPQNRASFQRSRIGLGSRQDN